MNKLVFDIGATNTKFAVMTPEGEILHREVSPTDYSSADNYFGGMARLVESLRQGADAIAISTNGRMTTDGDSYRAYTVKLLQGTNLRKELETRTGMPIAILNDGFSAALGEWRYGAGRGYDDMMALVLGSGLGAGILLDGKVYQGYRRNAAAVFSYLTIQGGKSEFSAMATSFTLLLYKLAAATQTPMEEMSGNRFFEILEQGNPIAAHLLDEYCESIAFIAYNAFMLLDLRRIVVTGGLSGRDIIIEQVNQKMREIPERFLAGEAAAYLDMIALDMEDFNLQVVKGELGADANLYGALHHLLSQTDAK